MKTLIYLLLIIPAFNVAIAQEKLGRVIKNANKGEARRKALVIGNMSYIKDKLKNTIRDADSMEVALKYLGFEVTKLTDGRHTEMEYYIENFIESLSSNDVAFVFYSGHGAAFERENYLIPIDFRFGCIEDLKFRSTKVSNIANRASARRVRNIFIVLDACRDVSPDMAYCGFTGDKGDKKTKPYLVKPESNPVGSITVFSTNYGNTSTDTSVYGFNGLYTESLLKYIRRPYGFREILDSARVRTKNYSLQLRPGKPAQTPQKEEDIDGDFYFMKEKSQIEVFSEELLELERRKKAATEDLMDTNKRLKILTDVERQEDSLKRLKRKLYWTSVFNWNTSRDFFDACAIDGFPISYTRQNLNYPESEKNVAINFYEAEFRNISYHLYKFISFKFSPLRLRIGSTRRFRNTLDSLNLKKEFEDIPASRFTVVETNVLKSSIASTFYFRHFGVGAAFTLTPTFINFRIKEKGERATNHSFNEGKEIAFFLQKNFSVSIIPKFNVRNGLRIFYERTLNGESFYPDQLLRRPKNAFGIAYTFW